MVFIVNSFEFVVSPVLEGDDHVRVSSIAALFDADRLGARLDGFSELGL
jgi:hypothetical protein